jgi:hypothetical protein
MPSARPGAREKHRGTPLRSAGILKRQSRPARHPIQLRGCGSYRRTQRGAPAPGVLSLPSFFSRKRKKVARDQRAKPAHVTGRKNTSTAQTRTKQERRAQPTWWMSGGYSGDGLIRRATRSAIQRRFAGKPAPAGEPAPAGRIHVGASLLAMRKATETHEPEGITTPSMDRPAVFSAPLARRASQQCAGTYRNPSPEGSDYSVIPIIDKSCLRGR